MTALEEYRRWCEYTQPLSLVERGKAKAAIDELEAKLDTALALAALREGWAKKPEDVLSEVEALTAPLLSRAEQAEAENERLITRYACDVICGMGVRGSGSCSNPYDAECPALPDFIAAAKEASC